MGLHLGAGHQLRLFAGLSSTNPASFRQLSLARQIGPPTSWKFYAMAASVVSSLTTAFQLELGALDEFARQTSRRRRSRRITRAVALWTTVLEQDRRSQAGSARLRRVPTVIRPLCASQL